MNEPSSPPSAARFLDFGSLRLRLLLLGLVAGLAAGLVSTLYRIILQKAESFGASVLSGLHDGTLFSGVLVAALWMLGALVLGRMVKAEPLLSGSGIPQVEGELLGQISMNWGRVLLGKFVGGALAVGLGLSLGREGPSVQLGAAAAKGFSRFLGRNRVEERFLVTAGASAGLAAAFNAPLSGVMFALEEVHKNFSPFVLGSAMVASLSADFLAKRFFGLSPVLHFARLEHLPLRFYGHFLALGVLLGLCGALFYRLVLEGQAFYAERLGIPPSLRILIPAAGALLVGPALPLLLGGGHALLEQGDTPLSAAAVLLAGKFAFTLLCFCSGAPGGIFFPMLAIGGAMGSVYALAASSFFPPGSDVTVNFLVVGMAGFFAAVVRAPLTGILLILEMTGSLSHLLSVSIVVFVASVTAELSGARPVYEALLVRLLRRMHRRNALAESGGKILLEVSVCAGSLLDGKRIRDIRLPRRCLVVSVIRGATEILPSGETTLFAGDRLVALVDEHRARSVRESLLALSGRCTSLER